jgi:hypothetical protein
MNISKKEYIQIQKIVNESDIPILKDWIDSLKGDLSQCSTFLKDKVDLLEDYDFRLHSSKQRGLEIKGLENLIYHIKNDNLNSIIRVVILSINSSDSIIICTDKEWRKMFGYIW